MLTHRLLRASRACCSLECLLPVSNSMRLAHEHACAANPQLISLRHLSQHRSQPHLRFLRQSAVLTSLRYPQTHRWRSTTAPCAAMLAAPMAGHSRSTCDRSRRHASTSAAAAAASEAASEAATAAAPAAARNATASAAGRESPFSDADATSVYLHSPWCKNKCHYCDFPVVAVGADGLERPAVQSRMQARSE